MEIINQDIQQYAIEYTSDASPVLQQIEIDTYTSMPNPQMLSGHFQGRLLAMISKMVCPKVILEIGTYTGYSALCLFEGLMPGGQLITLDIDKKLKEQTQSYFNQVNGSSAITYQIGDAKEIIPSLSMEFNLVFIDADKKNYGIYYDLIIDKVPSGGYILVDNVLWKGKILTPHLDKIAQSMVEFNKKIKHDERVENILLPIRDGIMIMQKK